jgi:hypothetical protein
MKPQPEHLGSRIVDWKSTPKDMTEAQTVVISIQDGGCPVICVPRTFGPQITIPERTTAVAAGLN